jgi:glutamyl-tRNA synthetase
MTKKVRVRFAPSPTGPLHIGGVRTALFNYLFAKKNGGEFILRIEDTDQNRYVEGAEQYIIDSLNWCNIPFDEGPEKEGNCGPYRQSERKELYKDYAKQLIASGNAYYAFDTPDSLNILRKELESEGKTFIYNWSNRKELDNSLVLTDTELKEKLDAGDPYVIRFLTPQDENLELNDIIRGIIKIDTNVLDDKVLYKSDGMPTYHLANIVDDHLMDISHVIRGEEWLPSLALHYQLYKAFGWEPPEFAHLPLIMKPVGKGKLSKRDGDKLGFPVFPLTWNESKGYKEEGYFSEAVVNFLALLGWNPGTEQEIFSLKELENLFSLERVNKSGARFDPDKTKWYNQHYLQEKDNESLVPIYKNILKEHDVITNDHVLLEKVIALIKERAVFPADFWNLSDYFFIKPSTYDAKASKKQWKEDTSSIMNKLISVLNNIEDFNSKNTESIVKEWIGDQELSFGKVMPPLRLIIVGDMKGPHIFDILELIGKEESIKRIEKAVAFFK